MIRMISMLMLLVACAGGGDDEVITEQTCTSSHECVNGVCECTTAGKDGDSCTSDEACPDECEVCE